MRFFTCVLCGLGFFVVVAMCDAQIFRRGTSRLFSSAACANGSCDVPILTRPALAPPDPLDHGVIDQGGGQLGPEPRPASVPAPAAKPVEPLLIGQADGDSDQAENFGVDWPRIVNRKYDGKDGKITLVEAMDFAKGSYEDTRKNFRLVVIGTPGERGPVATALAALPAEEKDKLATWFVSADHWSLKDSDGGGQRFETGGHPTVYLLAPDGAVIHRQDGWTSQDDVDAIRKGLKKYDPKRDPDLRKTPDSARVPALAWKRMAKKALPVALVCGGAVLVLNFLGRRKS